MVDVSENGIIALNYGKKTVRQVEIGGDPWWIAKDVCESLELNNITMAIQNLDEDEKLTSTLLMSGQKREAWLINESGLYNLIFRSNKPVAKAFRKWVTYEVLPQIRKTGKYTPINQQLSLPEIKALKEEITSLKQQLMIQQSDFKNLLKPLLANLACIQEYHYGEDISLLDLLKKQINYLSDPQKYFYEKLTAEAVLGNYGIQVAKDREGKKGILLWLSTESNLIELAYAGTEWKTRWRRTFLGIPNIQFCKSKKIFLGCWGRLRTEAIGIPITMVFE